jgi:hypothetical protein
MFFCLRKNFGAVPRYFDIALYSVFSTESSQNY